MKIINQLTLQNVFCDMVWMCGKINIFPFNIEELKSNKFHFNPKYGTMDRIINEVTYMVNLDKSKIYIRLCPGKVLYGTNYFFLTMDEAQQAVDIALEQISSFTFAEKISAPEEFIITRMDISTNLTLGSEATEDDYKAAVIYLNHHSLPRCKHTTFDTTAENKNKSHKVTAYMKIPEMLNKPAGHKGIDISTLADYIRFEIQFFYPYLNANFASRLRKATDFQSVFRELVNHANKKIATINLFGEFQSHKDVYAQIGGAWKRTDAIKSKRGFAKQLNTSATKTNAPNKAMEIAIKSKQTNKYYAMLNKFRKKDIYPYWCNELAGHRLIPFWNTKEAYDSKCTIIMHISAEEKQEGTHSNTAIKAPFSPF